MLFSSPLRGLKKQPRTLKYIPTAGEPLLILVSVKAIRILQKVEISRSCYKETVICLKKSSMPQIIDCSIFTNTQKWTNNIPILAMLNVRMSQLFAQ